MKKYFITGLVILLPLALTIAIVLFVFNLLTQPFAGIIKSIFQHYNIFEHGFLFLSSEQVQQALSQFIILLILFFTTVLIGIIARWFFIHYLIRLGEQLLQRLPIVSSIYNACSDVIKTLFTSETSSFKQVVVVRFPNPETFSIGLVTRDNIPSPDKSSDEPLVAVFVPTTPNPTSGFLVMFKESELIYINMKVEDAFKYIISCGVISMPFQTMIKNVAEGSEGDHQGNKG